jgi:hypothetical protein
VLHLDKRIKICMIETQHIQICTLQLFGSLKVAQIYSPAKDVHLSILTNIYDLLILGFWWFIFYIDYAVESLHVMDMTNIWDVSDIYTASVYRVEVNGMDESYLLQLCRWRHHVPPKCWQHLLHLHTANTEEYNQHQQIQNFSNVKKS